MTEVYRDNDEKKQRMLLITSIILDAMEYKRKLTIRQNKFIKENQNAVDYKKSPTASEKLD